MACAPICAVPSWLLAAVIGTGVGVGGGAGNSVLLATSGTAGDVGKLTLAVGSGETGCDGIILGAASGGDFGLTLGVALGAGGSAGNSTICASIGTLAGGVRIGALVKTAPISHNISIHSNKANSSDHPNKFGEC